MSEQVNVHENDIAVQCILREAILMTPDGRPRVRCPIAVVAVGAHHIMVTMPDPDHAYRMVPLLALSMEDAGALAEDILRAIREGSDPRPEVVAESPPELQEAVAKVTERANLKNN